ncbi:complement C1q subcomponent subunit C-like [Saccostrea echinata]|uniref:complement C1q subcomponent subunit C-like n=1 Tax=Saccostrea echinata TaxID=191078 RepID=UPI002A820D2D|nr:complement C1q subcomponent subunit C-like [Saccostrea echinata]
MTDLQSRVTLLERAVGKLTGNDHADFKNIGTIRIPVGGFGIPGFNKTLVAFYAYRGSNIGGVSPGYILKFSSVITNLGSHYNPSDGIFVAPVHGIYMFQWTMSCFTTGSNSCGTSLRVNDAREGFFLYSGENGNGYHNTGSKTVIMEAQAGNHVWIQTENWSNVLIESQSSFTGCLLAIF